MGTARFVGIDVAKAELVIAALPGGERWTVENDEKGIRSLIERLKAASSAGSIGKRSPSSLASLLLLATPGRCVAGAWFTAAERA
jgi:hypothetical protein